jgi:N-acetylmuramoyl-L-alanine amidase
MGSKYLLELPSILSNAGLIVKTVPGWETRARSSGGYEPGFPAAIVCHHTASPSNGPQSVQYCITAPTAPIGNLILDRDGTIYIVAAGASNHAGKGGPLGPIPQDGINARSIGIEACNTGVGEPWPMIQQLVYVKMVAVLAKYYNIAIPNIVAHFEWAPTRKIDPAGPSKYADGKSSWNMAKFRKDVQESPSYQVLAPTGENEMFFVRPAGQLSPVYIYNGMVKRKVMSDEDKNLLVLLFKAKFAGNGLPVEMSPVLLTAIPEV